MLSGAALFEQVENLLRQLDAKSYELSEIRKAEIRAKHSNFHGANVTEARENSARAASEFTIEAIDVQADVDSLLRWIDFYRLMITNGS